MKRKDVELVFNWPFILSPKSPCVHDDVRYWVRLGRSVGHFVALRDAKCAISVYLSKKGGAK